MTKIKKECECLCVGSLCHAEKDGTNLDAELGIATTTKNRIACYNRAKNET